MPASTTAITGLPTDMRRFFLITSFIGSALSAGQTPSAGELDHVHAAPLVGHDQQTAVVLIDVIAQRRLHVIGRLRNEIAELLGIGGIMDVDDAQPGAEPGDIKAAILVHLLP